MAAPSLIWRRVLCETLQLLGLREVLAREVAELGVGLGLGGRDEENSATPPECGKSRQLSG
jgi:hypothetical protein